MRPRLATLVEEHWYRDDLETDRAGIVRFYISGDRVRMDGDSQLKSRKPITAADNPAGVQIADTFSKTRDRSDELNPAA